MLARTLFRSLAKRSGLANNKQTRSFVSLFNRSSANALNRSVSKRSNLSLCCNVKTAVFTPKTIQKRYLSNEDALKDAGWNEESSKVMQKMDGKYFCLPIHVSYDFAYNYLQDIIPLIFKLIPVFLELFIWIEKYYTHPENDVQHKNLFDRIHELMESSEYHTVQDFCHYALVGTLLAAVTESEHARTHTLPLMQSIMREVPAKLDFLNECVALWHILSKANDNKNKPGKSFTEQLNDLDSVEEVDPFTK